MSTTSIISRVTSSIVAYQNFFMRTFIKPVRSMLPIISVPRILTAEVLIGDHVVYHSSTTYSKKF